MKSEELINVIDENKVKTALKLNLPIEITTYTLPRNMERYINDVVTCYLKESHLDYVLEYIKFCLGELLTNAKKANTKRVYFHEKKLDINNQNEYDKGMETFKTDTLSNIEYYLEEQKKEGYYIKVLLQKTEKDILVEVRNNARLTTFENAKIQDKINSVKKYDNVQEVLTKVIDQSEGAGLGIIIVILMLQKAGMTKDNYNVYTNDNETITRIILPVSHQHCKEMEFVSNEFANVCNRIPVTEENLNKINEIIAKDDSSNTEVIQLIKNDLNLTCLLLKEANKVKKDCVSVDEAIKILQGNSLKEIFAKNNPDIVIFSDNENISNIKNHSLNTAKYALKLFSILEKKDEITAEEIYICALLHDLGRILVSSISDDEKADFRNKCKENKIDDYILDEFFNDGYHCNFGNTVAKKWNLPEVVQEVINNHHTPEKISDKYQTVSNIIYVADIMDYFDKGMVAFYQINSKLLSIFDIKSEAEFKSIIEECKKN